MLTILIVAAVIGYVFAVPSPEKKETPTVVEHHHHYHVSMVRREVVNPQIFLVQAKILIAEARMGPDPVRLPEARTINPSAAIERYRSHERKPS